jgi:ABC-type multidrug transport system fused ATPase/permease subunit
MSDLVKSQTIKEKELDMKKVISLEAK